MLARVNFALPPAHDRPLLVDGFLRVFPLADFARGMIKKILTDIAFQHRAGPDSKSVGFWFDQNSRSLL